MSPPEPRCIIRIAIALACLKNKPGDQSIASYLLDLQSRFPVATEHGRSRDWRTYAHELEKQLTTLRAQRDIDQELLSKIPSDASQIASTSDVPPPKKKSKKNPTKDQHDLEWSWDQSRASWSRFLSSRYPSSPSLVTAHASLKGALTAPNGDLLSYASRLTDAILRALDAIHLFLFSPLNPTLGEQTQTTLGTSLSLKPEHIDSPRIALVSPLLMYILRTVLHTLVCTVQDSTKSKRPRQRQRATTLAFTNAREHIDKTLDHLLERILLPLLRALAPLCSARLAPLVLAPLKKDRDKVGRAVGKSKDKDKRTDSTSTDSLKMTDVRTDVFALIGASLEALDTLPPLVRPPGPGVGANRDGDTSIAIGIRDRLGLETIRELEALYTAPRAHASDPPPPPPLLGSLEPQPATPSEPPSPTPTPTQRAAPSQSRSQAQPQSQQRAITELRAIRLVRLAGTRADRVRALAARDAGWFLVSTLNLCVIPALAGAQVHGHSTLHDPAARRTDHMGELLREALLDRIGKLIRSVRVPFERPFLDGSSQQSSGLMDAPDDHTSSDCNANDSRLCIDQVCQNMLLAVCERAMSHLVSP